MFEGEFHSRCLVKCSMRDKRKSLQKVLISALIPNPETLAIRLPARQNVYLRRGRVEI